MARLRTSVIRKQSRLAHRASNKLQEKQVQIRSCLFRYDAALRIGGAGAYHEMITEKTGLLATKSHKAGDLRSSRGKRVWDEDIWILSSPLSEDLHLDVHVDWLWSQIEPHKAFFAQVISDAAWADLMLGCKSESPYPVLYVNTESKKIIEELNLRLAFNFTCV